MLQSHIKKIALFILVCLSINCLAQKTVENQGQNISIETTPIVDPKNPLDTLVSIKCIVDLTDSTSKADKINLKIGTSPNKADILDQDLKLYSKNEFKSSKMLFNKFGNRISLTIGDYPYRNYYYSAKIYDQNNRSLKELKYNRKQ